MKEEKQKGSATSPINIVAPHRNVKPEVESPELFGRKKLKYNGGPVIPNVEVFTVFIGSGWMKEPNHALTLHINNFFTSYLSSPEMDMLHQYDTKDTSIGRGKLSGSLSISLGGTAKNIDDKAIQLIINNWIKAGVVPQPSKNTLYFIYTDQGITVTMDGSSSCVDFCGYHSNFNAHNADIFYAVVPFPGCNGCTNGVAIKDVITITSSHELCEAITDPIPGTGWYNDKYGEIGDICAWTVKNFNEFYVQLEYSNKQKKCV